LLHAREVAQVARGAVQVRRVYDEARRGDGTRVLVDRVWPRGIRKDDLVMDDWVKTVAPSTQLRKWYSHDPGKFGQFRRRYRDELDSGPGREALDRLRTLARGSTLTLLTATKDTEHSHAAILAELLAETS
jgi:uncharacterized protein YeaO (DUF488 family)